MPVPGAFFCMALVQRKYSIILFEEYYNKTFKGNSGQLKRLMEGKRFSVDVKCDNSVTVSFDGPIIFVSNEHPYGDESFFV